MNSFPQAEFTKIIEKHSWKSILLNLIYEGKIDPWDIDIDIVIDEFMEKMKGMEKLDLYIPGNLILATSILLKYKSLRLFQEEEEDFSNEVDLDISVPQINLVKRMKPSRPITVKELVSAIENAIKISFKAIIKRKRKALTIEQQALPKFEKENIKLKMNKIWKELISIMDDYGIVRLKDFIKNKDRDIAISEFLIMLHMENESYLFMQQEEPFSEILVYLNKEKVIS